MKAFAFTSDRKPLHDFFWGADRRFSGLPFLEKQHEANIKAVEQFLQECVKKQVNQSK